MMNLIDVRTPEEYARGHIHGSINIPLRELPNRKDEIPQDATITCRTGPRAQHAIALLGFGTLFEGGVLGYYQNGGELINSEGKPGSAE